MPDPITRLIRGFQAFRDTDFEDNREFFHQLAEKGQAPEILVIACSDSRVDPAILTHSRPGDLFIVRNVAAIVPPYQPDGSTHGTSSAMEFAVRSLGVQHIIVLGHALCGGIKALEKLDQSELEFLPNWVRQVEPEIARIRPRFDRLESVERSKRIEQAAILISLRFLLTYPWITEKVNAGSLALHGWYFDIRDGSLTAAAPQTGVFQPLDPMEPVRAVNCDAATAPARSPDLNRFAEIVAPTGG